MRLDLQTSICLCHVDLLLYLVYAIGAEVAWCASAVCNTCRGCAGNCGLERAEFGRQSPQVLLGPASSPEDRA